MERETSQDFDQELWLIFDDYVHGHIDRRGFLDRAARFAVAGHTRPHAVDTARAVPATIDKLCGKLTDLFACRRISVLKRRIFRSASYTLYCFVIVKPVTVASVLCAKRMP